MTASSETFLSLESALNSRFRGHDTRDWQEWLTFATRSAADIPLDANRAWLSRVKASHRGLAKNKALKHLIAGAVNQDYLDEICTLEGLERLELEYPVTATSLAGLRALRNLRHLSVDSPRNITDFTPLLDLPSLRTLLITNAKRMADIAWLSEAHHLEVIGIEGSTWTTQIIPSLAPLAGLKRLRALLAVSTRLGDKDLLPLAECPNLEFLHCAMVAPREEFERLQRRMPTLVCNWFRPESWQTLGR